MVPLRYGHCDGHTDVCYSDSSKNFITCGSEGDVRVWEDVNDTDQKDLCVGEKAWAVCQKGKTLYVATDKNIVQAYTFPDLELDGIITRFTAPVTQIDISPDEKKIAAGSCDMDIHVVDMDSMENKTLSGHRAPILSISLDPRLCFLVSSSCDGSVRVWNIKTGDVEHQWDSFIEKSNSFERAPSLCRLHFQPIHGHFLAVPVKDKINIYARETWALVKALTYNKNDQTFSVVRYSKCGKYLAGGTIKGSVYIFNVSTEKVVAETDESINKNSRSITSISWHSKSTGVVFCNDGGQIGELLVTTASNSVDEAIGTEDLAEIPLGIPDFEDDDDDSENVISLERIKSESGFGQERFTSSPLKNDDKDDKESLISDRFSKFEPKIPFAELQEAFQPSSTPTHLQERFLLWNSVGIIRGFCREDSSDELDIEFHDTTLHHGFRMNNVAGYSMAALTEQAVVLASPRLADIPSKLCCILLKSWDGQKEWEANLGNEDAVGLAAGRNWVAVVTDRLFVRVYSIDGTQTDILSLPGPLISLCGHSDQLALFFHSAQGRDKDQFISYMLVHVNSSTKLCKVHTTGPLPLVPSSTIKWVGFSDEGSLSTLDSEGFLRVLYDKQWRPICSLEDRAKGKFDHYFVLGLSEKTHTIRCILCKGAYYPPVVPKPIVNEIEWQIPLADLDTDKGKLEEELLRSVVTISNLKFYQDEIEDTDSKSSIEKAISVSIMKLFALACRSGLECRAVSLCESMPSVDVVKLASKYAAKLGRHQLASRVSQVAARLSEEENNRLLNDISEVDTDNDDRVSLASRQDGSSQDIFADHDSSNFKNTSKMSEKENLIMKMRKKKSMSETPEQKPNILEGQKRFSKNPFKKSNLDDEVKANSDKELPSTPRPNYLEWFNQNKSVLQAEHPLLKDSELAIIGMKKYRQIHNTSQAESISSSPSVPVKDVEKEPIIEEKSEPKKRKLSDIMNESVKKKQSVAEVTPKNKNPSNNEKKPVSAASKLKNFSFVKKS